MRWVNDKLFIPIKQGRSIILYCENFHNDETSEIFRSVKALHNDKTGQVNDFEVYQKLFVMKKREVKSFVLIK